MWNNFTLVIKMNLDSTLSPRCHSHCSDPDMGGGGGDGLRQHCELGYVHQGVGDRSGCQWELLDPFTLGTRGICR